MASPLKSLASRSSLSTCSSEGGDGEATPRSTAVRERCSLGEVSPCTTLWADEMSSDVGDSTEEACGVKAAAPESRTRGGKWRAVWCYERCYKSEEEAVRNTITEAVTGLGGSLICFKKARTFEARAPRMHPQSYALITDGREARPCMQALAAHPQNHPALIIVVSEQPKHNARVVRWAEGLPAEGFHVPVFVVRSAAEVAPILAKSALPLGGTAGTAGQQTVAGLPFNLKVITAEPTANCVATPTYMASTSPSMMLQRKLMGCGDATRTQQMPWPTPGMDATRSHEIAWSLVAQPSATEPKPIAPWPTSSEAPFLLEKSVEGVAQSVLCVLSAVVPSCAGPNTLEKLLALSAPEVYEE
eukprot:CAMPEP_0170229468 /NCGR_PEP_ID=MMETSP0116_2-20130129/14458_1 /TAXON_ID=400756 /ORGANISM="Durinskia baltica, Strain CSIRO CS-38" /LENGTH=358 /DNA_ID=CAMNT_0010480219 /DNA_START=76 /DNA_END=1152 /DNA_ORIENTATION=+